MPALSIDSKVRATNASAQVLATGVAATIITWTELLDNNAEFAAATGIFTATTTGFYLVDAGLSFAGVAPLGTTFIIRIVVNGVAVAEGFEICDAAAGADEHAVHVHEMVQVAAGQTILIQALVTGASPTLSAIAIRNYLSILQAP